MASNFAAFSHRRLLSVTTSRVHVAHRDFLPVYKVYIRLSSDYLFVIPSINNRHLLYPSKNINFSSGCSRNEKVLRFRSKERTNARYFISPGNFCKQKPIKFRILLVNANQPPVFSRTIRRTTRLQIYVDVFVITWPELMSFTLRTHASIF